MKRHYPSHKGMYSHLFQKFSKSAHGRHEPGGPEASAWSVTGTDQLPEDNGGVEISGTLTGSADFNAYGSCRPPRIWLLGSVWILSVLRLDSVWGSVLAPSWLRPGSILVPLADQSRAGPERGRNQNHGFWMILEAPF